MQDPIDRHVEAQDLWEDMHDAQSDDDDGSGESHADRAYKAGMDQMALLTDEWAIAAEVANRHMREMYDKVRQGTDPDAKI